MRLLYGKTMLCSGHTYPKCFHRREIGLDPCEINPTQHCNIYYRWSKRGATRTLGLCHTFTCFLALHFTITPPGRPHLSLIPGTQYSASILLFLHTSPPSTSLNESVPSTAICAGSDIRVTISLCCNVQLILLPPTINYNQTDRENSYVIPWEILL